MLRGTVCYATVSAAILAQIVRKPCRLHSASAKVLRQAAMHPRRRNGEVFAMNIDDVEGYGEMPTQQELLDVFANIVSPRDWAQRWGACINLTPEECLRIARMLEMATSTRVYPEFNHPPFRALFPTATAATWWIFLNGDGVSDADLCERLGNMMTRGRFDPDADDAPARARTCVFLVEEVLRREGIARLSAALQAEDDAKGKGKRKGEGTQRPREAEGKGPRKGKGTRRSPA